MSDNNNNNGKRMGDRDAIVVFEKATQEYKAVDRWNNVLARGPDAVWVSAYIRKFNNVERILYA